MLLLLPCVLASEWAVLIAGSSGYGNYRHQADVAHAYQLLVKNGMKKENIITMMFDDVAKAEENPFPGKLFNKPSPAGTPGFDVYAGIKIDFKGADVSLANFKAVLTGDKKTVENVGTGRVLESKHMDDVFVNFVDHGGVGLIALPNEVVHVQDLLEILHTMHNRKMYNKLTFYLEACESGSMFEKLPKNINIYALSAANAEESSWGTYCPPQSSVDGKDLQTCLGDLFSVNWIQDTERSQGSESLLKQFQNVKKLTNKSHVLQWGDTVDFNTLKIGAFLGPKMSPTPPDEIDEDVVSSAISVRDIDVEVPKHYADLAEDEVLRNKAKVAHALELKQRDAVKEVYTKLVQTAYPGDAEKQELTLTGRLSKPEHRDCELALFNTLAACKLWKPTEAYPLSFQRVTVNLCGDEELGWGAEVDRAIAAGKQACLIRETLII